ncbi:MULTISPECIES: distal tail protein Dit [Bacillus cereus group]|uniref:Phage tail protein n=1 Tax=Bacillus proteolyticus TaxID=2026192 RepID=A0ABV3I8X3_9BACI|nr:distal tail protein Dit [Bacillus cereus group sp. N8]MBJ8103585.1 phage tail protein [Bacillus cereus group sp. N8]
MLDIGINNELVSSFGVYMVGRPVIPTTEQEVEHIIVPGRHGSLTKKGAYKDVPLKVKFNLLENENIKPLIRRVKSLFINGETLFFTDDEVYRKIKHVKIGDIVNDIEEHGEFEVEFTLDPFEYVTTVPIVLTKPENLLNPGTIESAPKLVVYGGGDVTITINDVSFRIKGVAYSVTIDSGLLEAYVGTTSMNSKMIGEFPLFKPGINTISWSESVTKIIVEPRWRYV